MARRAFDGKRASSASEMGVWDVTYQMWYFCSQFASWGRTWSESIKDEGRDPPVSRAMSRPSESGRQDSNLRPLGPENGAEGSHGGRPRPLAPQDAVTTGPRRSLGFHPVPSEPGFPPARSYSGHSGRRPVHTVSIA